MKLVHSVLLSVFSVCLLACSWLFVPSNGFVPPGGLTNVTLWYDLLDASTYSPSGGKIPALADKSPSVNNAAEANATLQPEYDATGINGFPSAKTTNIAFSGGQGMTMLASPARSPCSVFAVVKVAGTTATVFGNGASANYGFFFPATNFILSTDNVTYELEYAPGVTINTGAIVEIDMAAAVGSSTIYIDNVQKTPLLVDVPWPTGAIAGYTEFLRGTAGIRDFNGWIGEIIIADFANSTQRNATYTYLKAKWGTP